MANKKCKKCGRRVSSYCSHCNDSDLIDDVIDLGIGLAINSFFDSNDSGGSSSSGSEDNSGNVDFGGGDFGGGGAGGDW